MLKRTPPESTRQGKHVYTIDDDQPFRLAMSRALEIFGYDVHQFDSANDFLAHAVLFRPAVLLMDMQMPGLSGVQLQAQLKTSGWQVPVIFISGDSSVAQSIGAMKQGALDFLCKPFDLDQLTAQIETALAQDKQHLQRLEQQQQCQEKLDRLKPREQDAYACLSKGFSYAEMMKALSISLPTAKQYRAAVMRKLEFASLAELMAFHHRLTGTPD
jgi:two-component system response regulator FixJ